MKIRGHGGHRRWMAGVRNVNMEVVPGDIHHCRLKLRDAMLVSAFWCNDEHDALDKHNDLLRPSDYICD